MDRLIAASVVAVIALLPEQVQVPPDPGKPHAAAVDANRIGNADREPGAWMSHGRTYDEQRYSPLDQLHTGNVKELGLAWFADLDTSRKQEATPIVVDGAVYVTTAWSMVKAFDVRSGDLIWEYDPQVDPAKAVDACCDVVNRGAAVWRGKVFVATIDGRLVALNSATGDVLWQRMTVDASKPYTVTGAPRVVKGRVLIGNGGAELGVRGYVSAYDADSGQLAWRFYTVPGDPAKGFEQPALEMAAGTWSGEWWRLGGGGTVWDAMAYDPGLDLLYIGTGNGSPWNQRMRSPAGGDNLFLSSIVALDPDDGSYRWHYQTTPGESWDYTATQHMIIADLMIDGRERRVLMQAPKNGFFYVLDAGTGELISAEPFAAVNWATHVDRETGRPVEVPEARYYATGEPFIGQPSYMGAHNWHPMAFNPRTGLVYIPASDNAAVFAGDKDFVPTDQGWNTGTDYVAGMRVIEAAGKTVPERIAYLLAWDPVAQEERWRVPQAHPQSVAGVLTTAGGLVFQGNADGGFVAYDARNGETLWSARTQAGVVAAPISFAIDDEQYVAILVGTSELPEGVSATAAGSTNNSRLLVYKAGGSARLPDLSSVATTAALPPDSAPAVFGSNEDIARGEELYARFCNACHGVNGVSQRTAVFPDLRRSERLASATRWRHVVIGGELRDKGMVSFQDQLTEQEAEAVRAYIVRQANDESRPERATP